MSAHSRFRTKLRRRREGKTDYHARKAFLLSGRLRLVARISVSNITAQVVVAKPTGDEVVVSAHSRELGKKYGWKAPNGNLPAAYLTGLLCGLKAKAKGVKEAILDIGLYPPSKGARIFAVLRGFLDAKVDVPHSEDKLPDEGRTKGEHIAKYAESLLPEQEEYRTKFSEYLAKELPPETLPKHVAQVRVEMVNAYKSRGKKT